MVLWIIAALAGAVLLGGVAYLASRKSESEVEDAWQRPRNPLPWDGRAEEPEGTRVASVPPPAGIPRLPTASEEVSASHFLESQEMWLFEDDEPTGPVPRILVRAAGRTHPGQRREHNEDAFLVLPEHEIYAIADGMGGYAAGEVAAQIVVDTLRERFEEGGGEIGAELEGFPRRGAELIEAIQASNSRIRAEAALDESKAGMGTTVVAARFSPGRKRVYVTHVGDSRCYRIRDGAIKRLTTDHTLGELGMTGPAARKLSRAVGVFDEVEVDLSVEEPQPGDLYLLCSDGVCKMLDDATILATVDSVASVHLAAEALVDAANERGGRDNVTVVLMGIDEPGGDREESGEHRLPMG